MKATQFEFRFRLWISFALYVLGFWAPWLRYGKFAAPFTTARLELAGELTHWLPLQTASNVITFAAIALAALGAMLRVWGTANHRRNPLYLGYLAFAVAVSIFMPPSGAILFLILTFVQMWRLSLRAETRSARSEGRPRWSQTLVAAIFSEVFYVAMAVCFAILAWRYDPTLLIQALLICFGASLVAQAFVPQAA